MNFFSGLTLLISSIYLSIVPVPEFREGLVGQPVSFMPMEATNQIEKTISKLLFRGLFTYDIFGELTPDLVDTWEISEDGRSYIFKLKDNQYWIDGSQISADDVFYTSINTSALQGIEINKIDDLTIKFTLQNKYAPFLHTLTTGIIKNNSLEEGSDLNPISSGKFRVISLKRQGPLVEEVTLYSKEMKIPKLTFRFYNSQEELIWASELLEIDGFLYDGETTNVDLQRFVDHPFPLISASYGLFFNLKEGVSIVGKDDRVKISRSINFKDQLSEFGIPVEGVISRSSFTNKKINFDKFDRKTKLQLSVPALEITLPDYKNNPVVANRLKQELEDNLGVEVNLKPYNPDQFVEDIIQKNSYQAIFFGIENSRDPDRYLNWHSSGIGLGYNFTNFQNPVSDQALEQGRIETDNAKRKTHYNKFQEIFDQNQPAIFLFHPKVNYYVSNKVKGITEKYTFDLTDRFNDYNNWSIN